ncbi:MAG: hypothetical protein IJ661_04720 [Lachnospiraceae bacterium]|nr:hypothetical protein [Lachnospiraceae bacterium]
MNNIDNNNEPYNSKGLLNEAPYQTPYSGSNDYTSDVLLHSGAFLRKEDNKAVLDEVLNHIHKEIADTLDKCGIYYRLNSRVKSANSTDKKLSTKINNGEWLYRHNPKNHMQDLFGFRILIYFVEDMPILKRLLSKRFTMHLTWEEKTNRKEEFGAISTNGVFIINKKCLPSSDKSNLSEELQEVLKGQLVDPTFEIQLRTVTFDAWHEIDHDYSYKFTNMWKDQSEYLRRFHSILATLELCDDTTVTTLENLAYDIYARQRHPGRYEENDNTKYIYDEKDTNAPALAKNSTEKATEYSNETNDDTAVKDLYEADTAKTAGDSDETDDNVIILKNIVTKADKAASKMAKRSTLCDWDRMIRAHFRLRIEHIENAAEPNQELLPEIKELFETDNLTEQNDAYRFVKYVLRFRKETLIRLFYDPKTFLKKTQNDYTQPDNSSETSGNIERLWESYDFKSKIPITVNSIIIMILLYKDAREASLTDNQSKLLAKNNIKSIVCKSYQSNIIEIASKEGRLFSFLNAYDFTQGWNTVLKNDLRLTTSFASDDILPSMNPDRDPLLDHILNIISMDVAVLWSTVTEKLPTPNDILPSIKTSGKYVFDADNREYKMYIKIEEGIIYYYIEYPGLQYSENTWRQKAAFIPVINSNIREAKGDISIQASIAIELMHNTGNDATNTTLPAITKAHIFRAMSEYSKNTIYPARPYIGQKKAFRERTHGTDVIYIKKHILDDGRTYELMISQAFESLYKAYNVCDGQLIQPLVLLLFKSENALYDAELTIARFYNRIAHTAYVYMGIINDENDPIFSEYYKDEAEGFISLANYNITDCGLYVIGYNPGNDKDSCLLSLSFTEINSFDYQIEKPDGLDIPETVHGLEGIMLLLERELIKYNMAMPMPPILSAFED